MTINSEFELKVTSEYVDIINWTHSNNYFFHWILLGNQ